MVALTAEDTRTGSEGKGNWTKFILEKVGVRVEMLLGVVVNGTANNHANQTIK